MELETIEKIEKGILIIILIALIGFASYTVITESQHYKPPLADCNDLTNATYDNYSNSHVCRWNGTGWEPLFWNPHAILKGEKF